MKEGFSEERAFELGLENTLDVTSHSRQREQPDQRLTGGEEHSSLESGCIQVGLKIVGMREMLIGDEVG